MKTPVLFCDDGTEISAGTACAFGTVATAGITAKAVTYAKIQDVTATARVLGRKTAGSSHAGDPGQCREPQCCAGDG